MHHVLQLRKFCHSEVSAFRAWKVCTLLFAVDQVALLSSALLCTFRNLVAHSFDLLWSCFMLCVCEGPHLLVHTMFLMFP